MPNESGKAKAVVKAGGEWLRPKEISSRYNVQGNTLCLRMKRWEETKVVKLKAMRGPSGRILAVKLTPDLRALLEAMQ